MNEKHVNRRRFLQQTGAALAGAIGFPYIVKSSALGKAGTVAPSNRLTVGCIGMGGMGTLNMKGFANFPEVRVIAVCDVDRDRRQNAKTWLDQHYQNEDCAAYGDFRDLVARNDIDIIMNATPDHWHAIPSLMAIRSGKDVYCEKPVSLTIAEGRALADTARRYGAVTQVGTWQRSISQFQYAARLAQGGYLGTIKTAKVGCAGSSQHGPQPTMPVPDGFDYDLWLGQAPWAPYTASRCHGAFRFCFDYSGGGICDWGAHMIDEVQWYMGKDGTGPVAVEGKGEFPAEGVWNTAVSYDCRCEYEDGFTLHIGTPGYYLWGVTLEGSDGRWLHVDRDKLTTNPESLKRDLLQNDKMLQLWVSAGHLGNFLDGVKSRKPTITPFEVGHRSLTVAHLCNISMRLGRKVLWNPQAERFVNDPDADRMLSRAMRSPWHL